MDLPKSFITTLRSGISGTAGGSHESITASRHVTASGNYSLCFRVWHNMIWLPRMVPLETLMWASGAGMSVVSARRNWMQPGAGLPRVFSYIGKRVLPRRFRDSAAQALELPQHNSGTRTEAIRCHLLILLAPLHSHRSDKQTRHPVRVELLILSHAGPAELERESLIGKRNGSPPRNGPRYGSVA